MLDSDLAELYQIPTKSLNLAVKRNRLRFPSDFMFQLNHKEFETLRFQIETSKTTKRGGRRTKPFVFSQEGVAMLSSVIHTEQAILANIAIMRTFIKMREMIYESKEITKRIDDLEVKYDSQFASVFKAIREIVIPHKLKKDKKIGLISE